MIPPALFEIIKNISETILNKFKSNRFEYDDLRVTNDESFDEPASRMCKSEQIKECKSDVSEGVLFLFSVDSAICSIWYLFVIVVLEIAIEVCMDRRNCWLFALYYTTFTKYAKYMRTAK